MAGPEKLLTLDEVAEVLGVSCKAVYNGRHRGDAPPALKVGRYLRWRPEDVTAWIAARVERPA